MPKFAVNLSTIFTEYPLLQRFALAKAQGFDVVEIQFPYELSIDQIQTQLHLQQLKLCLINVPAGDLMQGGNGLAGIPGKELEFAQALEHAVEYAEALKVPRINVLAGRQPSDHSPSECLNTLIENLKLACAAAEKINCQVLIELINGVNMPDFLVQEMQTAQFILSKVQNPRLKLQYDCYHMAMMGQEITQHCIDHLDLIAHIQFADCPGRHEPNSGDLDFATFFKTIQKHGYTGYVAAEYFPQAHSLDSFAWKKQLNFI